MSFDAIEAATVTNAMGAIANATATIGAATVIGIFDAVDASAFGVVSGNSPQFTCASADVTSVTEGTTITINSVSYTVAEIHPDGTGITVLKLETA